jgi:hypothetical protein
MGFLGTLISGGVGGIVASVSEAVDKFVQTPDEAAKLQVELLKIANEQRAALLASADSYEKELTERQQNDLQYGTPLTKNIRPVVLIYLLIVFTLAGVADGNLDLFGHHFNMKPQYVEATSEFLLYVMMFYFGGRTIEKVASAVGEAWRKK